MKKVSDPTLQNQHQHQHKNRKTHLKKVVDPPEPYSRTFIPGFRTEHINSTPPLSSITVLDFKIKIL